MSSKEKIPPCPPEPYPGLRPYREDERDKFFGRDTDAEILIDKILTNRLTLLFAASGVGKSSLLQAAVIPHLKAPTGENLSVVYHIDWVSEPVRSVRTAIVQALREDKLLPEDTQEEDSDDTLVELLEFCSLFVRPPLVLILDQFEEFFRYQRHKEGFQTFIDQLAAVIVDKSLSVSLVLSMREDFALELDAFKPKMPTILFENFYRLKKLEREATRRAIATPVEQLGYRYEPALLETLLTDLLSRELDRNPNSAVAELRTTVEPPYLQIVCSELWELNKADPEKVLRLATYEKAGRAKGILKHYLEGVLQQFSAEEKQIASQAFDHLVSNRGVKVAYTARALADVLRMNEVKLCKVLDRLEGVRILRKQQREEEMWYELYHDMFSGSIEDWNTVWKDRMRSRKLLRMAGGLCVSAAVLFAGWDYYINASEYHLRLSSKAGISDRVELWQGKLGSTDLFGQQHYLAETDFTRHDLEPDKLFEKRPLADYGVLQTDLIGNVPVDRRVTAYAVSGEYPMGLGLAEKSINPQQIELAKKTLEQLADVSTKEAVQVMYENLDSPSDAIKQTASNAVTLTGGIALARNEQNITPEKQAKHTDFWVEEWGRQIVTRDARKQLVALERQDILFRFPNLFERELIVSSLKSKDSDVRYTAAKVLGELKAMEAVPGLLALLQDEDSNVRYTAAGVLGELKAMEAVPDLRILLKDEDSNMRSTAAEVLGKLKAMEAVPDLRILLKDEDSNMRSTATEVLGELKAMEAVPDLLALLKDKDSGVRSTATEVLVGLKAMEPIPAQRALLKDEDSNVRSTAAGVLGELKAMEATPDLRALLKDGDPDVRQRAAGVLGELKAMEAVPDLLALLKDEDSNVRYTAAEALARLKATEAVPNLLALLKDEDSNVRSTATEVLGELKAMEAIPDLLALLQDENSSVRSTATGVLGELKAMEAIPGLLALLKDEDSSVRSTATEVLGELKAMDAIPGLLALLQDENSSVSSTAAKVLGELKAMEAIPGLLALLQDEDSSVRSNAAEMLGRLQATEAVPNLLTLLKDRDSFVRYSAAGVLGELKAMEATPDLRALLKDGVPYVRQRAAGVLGELKAMEATPDLRALLKDGDPDVRQRAAGVLGELKAMEAIPDLRALLKDGDPDVRQRAAGVLGELKATEAVPAQRVLLQDEDSSVRSNAAEALAGLKATEAVSDLLTLLQDEDSVVRQRAAGALAGLKATEAVPDLLTLLQDEDSVVRQRATEALVGLKATEAVPDLLLALRKDEYVGVSQEVASVLAGLKFENMTSYWLSNGFFSDDLELSSHITVGGLLGFLIHNLESDSPDNRNNAVMSALRLERSSNLTKPQKYLLEKALSLVDQETRNEAVTQLAEEDKTEAEEQSNQVSRPINQPGLEEKPLALNGLEAKLDEFDQGYADWRDRRDAAPNTDTQAAPPASPNEADKFADPAPFIYEYAFAIANMDEAEGIKLLGHNLQKVREAAARGLANSDFLNVALLKKLEQHWLTTDDPIERQGLYHAIDLCLSALETIGGAKERDELKTYLQELEEKQSPSVKSIKPRVEWTHIQIDWREGALAELQAITDKQMPGLLKEYCLNPDGTDMKPEECTIER